MYLPAHLREELRSTSRLRPPHAGVWKVVAHRLPRVRDERQTFAQSLRAAVHAVLGGIRWNATVYSVCSARVLR